MDSKTQQKALAINLDSGIYGTFAEIGAGQEVARLFFAVGGAAGTIAKSMSAYDMLFSDAIYGKASRYVARDRLLSMLNHEYGLLQERLAASRGAETRFFAFADTVSARNYKGTNDCHGWMGIRFQLEPDGEPNDILLHVRMLDESNLLQQQALGFLGVNLVHGAFFQALNPKELIRSLADDLGTDRIEIDMIEFLGPAFLDIDNRAMSLCLVQCGFTNAIMFGPDRKVRQPSEVLYKRPVLFQRGSFRPLTLANLTMLGAAKKHFDKMLTKESREPVTLLEITVNNLLASGSSDASDFLDLADSLSAEGFNVLISNYPEHYRLVKYFRRYTKARLGAVMGVNSLIHVFNEKYYAALPGGILEAMGQLFSGNVHLFVYPMKQELYDIFLFSAFQGSAPVETPDKPVITAENISLPQSVRTLYNYLMERNYLVSVNPPDDSFEALLPTDVIALMKRGHPSWKQHVPSEAAKVIAERALFGLNELKP